MKCGNCQKRMTRYKICKTCNKRVHKACFVQWLKRCVNCEKIKTIDEDDFPKTKCDTDSKIEHVSEQFDSEHQLLVSTKRLEESSKQLDESINNCKSLLGETEGLKDELFQVYGNSKNMEADDEFFRREKEESVGMSNEGTDLNPSLTEEMMKDLSTFFEADQQLLSSEKVNDPVVQAVNYIEKMDEDPVVPADVESTVPTFNVQVVVPAFNFQVNVDCHQSAVLPPINGESTEKAVVPELPFCQQPDVSTVGDIPYCVTAPRTTNAGLKMPHTPVKKEKFLKRYSYLLPRQLNFIDRVGHLSAGSKGEHSETRLFRIFMYVPDYVKIFRKRDNVTITVSTKQFYAAIEGKNSLFTEEEQMDIKKHHFKLLKY